MVSRGAARAALVLCFALPVPLWAQGSPPPESGAAEPEAEPTAEELARVLAELRQLRKGYYVRRQDQQAELDAARASVAKLQAEVTELEADRARQVKDSKSIREEIASLEKEREELESKRASMLAPIQAFAGIARRHVEEGIPYRVDSRLATIEGFRTADNLPQAFSRLWSFFEDEMRIGRSGETYTSEVPLPGDRSKHARVVRVGKLVLGFVTEDGSEVGLWTRGEGWVTDLDAVRTEAVRTAVEILDRRRAPELVSLPVLLKQVKG